MPRRRFHAGLVLLLVAAASGRAPAAEQRGPTTPIDLDTRPTGAEAYLITDDAERSLGLTPLEDVRLPRGLVTLRFELEGHQELIDSFEVGEQPRSYVFQMVPAKKPATVELDGPDAVEGARVLLDGRTAGEMPTSLEVAPGRHLVEVRHPGRRPWTRWFDAEEGDHRDFRVRLHPAAEAEGVLRIEATPEEAEIRVDGVERGAGSARVGGLRAGPHRVEVRHPSHEPASRRVEIAPGAMEQVRVELDEETGETGELAVRTDVRAARIRVEDAPAGRSPVVLRGLEPGSYRVEAELNDTGGADAPSAGSSVREVEVRAGETSRVELRLREPREEATGRVRIVADVAEAKGRVNDGETRPLPTTFEDVPEGTHFVTVEAPGHRTWKKRIRVPAGERIETVAELEPRGRTHRPMGTSARSIDPGAGHVDVGFGWPFLFRLGVGGGVTDTVDLTFRVRTALDAVTFFEPQLDWELFRSSTFALALEGGFGFGFGGERRVGLTLPRARALGSFLVGDRAAVTASVGGGLSYDKFRVAGAAEPTWQLDGQLLLGLALEFRIDEAWNLVLQAEGDPTRNARALVDQGVLPAHRAFHVALDLSYIF